jgi:hypothetical protein
MGLIEGNIIIWLNNGIEYYYPRDILATVFACRPDALSGLSIVGDVVSLNGISRTKNELANDVLRHLDISTVYPEEFVVKLLRPINQAIQ